MQIGEAHKKLIKDGDAAFNRGTLLSFWQEVALNFFPEMSDFTTTRTLGEEFADHLTTSYPLLARRTLGNSLSAMLRPVQLETGSPGVWFQMGLYEEPKGISDTTRWMEWATRRMYRAMYDRRTQFVRATKESDHCFATFGQTVLQVSLNRMRDGLLYKTWHLRDCTWLEDAEGVIYFLQRKWTPTVTELAGVFGNKVSPKVKEKLDKDPSHRVRCRHTVIRAEEYEQRDPSAKLYRTPWVSVWIDEENDWLMEEVGSPTRMYMVPRWVTVPGTQYAVSPAVTAALPDARLIQAMTLTMLDSSEKLADPPFVAKANVFRDGIDLTAGGVSIADVAYDQKVGDSFAPLYEPRAGEGLNAANAMKQEVEDRIAEAFFLDSLSLPPADVRDMTAFEVGQRISEWIRRAMPIFEPMEFEYNGELCDMTFELMWRNGGLGPLHDIPREIMGEEIKWQFESPLHENNDRMRGQKLLEAKAVMMEMAELDPLATRVLRPVEALRDVLKGMGLPSTWHATDDELEEAEAELEQEVKTRKAAEALESLGASSKDLADASKSFSEARQIAGEDEEGLPGLPGQLPAGFGEQPRPVV